MNEESIFPASHVSVLALAWASLGLPFVYGGTSRAGVDCSGFVSYIYSRVGIELPRTVAGIVAVGTYISAAQALPGDIVVWSGHIGIYAGQGQVFEATAAGSTSIRELYGTPRYLRVL